jgi:hypothetical protein
MPLQMGLGLEIQYNTGATPDAAGGDSGALYILMEDGAELLAEDNSNLLTES